MPPGIPSPPGSAGGDAAGRGGLLPAEATTAERSALVQEPKSASLQSSPEPPDPIAPPAGELSRSD